MKITLPAEINNLFNEGCLLTTFLTPNSQLNKKLLLNTLSQHRINYGLYAFWWTGKNEALLEKYVTIHTQIGDKDIRWLKEDFLKICLQKNKLPLYIGKTSNFQNRISQHLCLGTETWKKQSHGRLYKKTTSCQFRSGIEHLFNYQGLKKNIEIFKNITLSFVPIANDKRGEGIKNRFYLEDLAIGYFRPWFNVDGER